MREAITIELNVVLLCPLSIDFKVYREGTTGAFGGIAV